MTLKSYNQITMKNCTVICLLIFTIILSSCAQTKTIVNSCYAAYKNDDFTRQDIAIKKIAILPVLVHEGKEHLRRPMEESLHKHLINSFGYLSVVSTDEVSSVLNKEDLIGSYSRAIDYYNNSGILQKDVIDQMGKALDVKYLLYTKLLTNCELSTSLYMAPRIRELYMQCLILDTYAGDVVWEGNSGVAKIKKDTTNLIDLTALGLSQVLGHDKTPEPCEDREDLINYILYARPNLTPAVGVGSLILLSFLALVLLTP